jgi:hypothetical protein
MDLFDVFVFCAIYSGVVVYSLWMTVSDKVETKMIKVRKS